MGRSEEIQRLEDAVGQLLTVTENLRMSTENVKRAREISSLERALEKAEQSDRLRRESLASYERASDRLRRESRQRAESTRRRREAQERHDTREQEGAIYGGVAIARFVQVSILSEQRLWPRQWDTLDGTPDRNLKVGDRVVFKPIWHNVIPSARNGLVEGIVRAVDAGRFQPDYNGPWSVARRP